MGYVDTDGSAANASSYSFPGKSLGTPSATRRIVVAVASRIVGQAVTAVTVGGVSLSQDADTNVTQNAELWSGIVPTGSTGDVGVTFSIADTYCGIGIWALDNMAPTGAIASVSSTGAPVLDVATEVGDFVIGAYGYRVSSVGPKMAWNAATERYDAAVDGAVRQHAGADLVAAGSTADMGGTVTNYAGDLSGVAAAYRTVPAAPPNEGTAAGAFAWASIAAGATAQRGTAAGSYTWAGSAAGQSVKRGTAAGPFTFSSSATGQHSSRGAAAGAFAFGGSAVGETPAISVPDGIASGSFLWDSSAAGQRVTHGAAAGTFDWTSEAAGATAHSGSAVGTFDWASFAKAFTEYARELIIITGLRLGDPTPTGLVGTPMTAERVDPAITATTMTLED